MSDTYDYTKAVQEFTSQYGDYNEWQSTKGREKVREAFKQKCQVNSDITYLLWQVGNEAFGDSARGEKGVKLFKDILMNTGQSEAAADRMLEQGSIGGMRDIDDLESLRLAANLTLKQLCKGTSIADIEEALDYFYKEELIEFVQQEVVSDLTPLLTKQTEDTIDCVTESASIIDEIIKMIDEQFYGKILPAFNAQSAAKRLVQRDASDSIGTGNSGAFAKGLQNSSRRGSRPAAEYAVVGTTGANYDHVTALIQQTDAGPYPYDHFQDFNMLNRVLGDSNKKYSLYWLSLMTAVSNEIYDICTKLKTDFETTSAPTEEDPEPVNNLTRLQSGDNEMFNRYSDAFVSGAPSTTAVFGAGSLAAGNGLWRLLNRNSQTSPQNAPNPIGIVEQVKTVETAVAVATNIIKKSNPDLAQLIVKYVGFLNVQVSQLKDKADCVREAMGDVGKARGKALLALTEAIKNAEAGNGTPLYIDDDDIAAALEKARNNIRFKNLNDLRLSVSPKNKRTFKEQCFLLAFAAKFAAYKKYTLDSAYSRNPKIHKRLAYDYVYEHADSSKVKYNASVQVDGSPFGFINRLTQSPSYESLVNISHTALSSLQPKIRLFKVVYNDELGQTDNSALEQEVEIKFNSSFNSVELNDIFKDKKSRSAGVGLSSFEFTYDGSNPFAAKKSIKANLKLFANTFSELFYVRKGEATYGTTDENGAPILAIKQVPYRYIDLALKTGSDSLQDKIDDSWPQILEDNAQLSKLNFRLKAVVGWSLPNQNIPGVSAAELKLLKNAIADSFVTLNLTPTVHNFEFDQQGRVVFNIDYLAYVEDFFDDRTFNSFADSDQEVSIKREVRRLKMKQYRKKCGSAEQISEENEQYAASVTKDIAQSLSSIVSGLFKDNRIYYLNFPYSKLSKFIAAGPYERFENYIEKPIGEIIQNNSNNTRAILNDINNAIEGVATQTNNARENNEEPQINIGKMLFAESPDENNVSFFYLSDLVDTVLKNIQIEIDNLINFYEDSSSIAAYVGTRANKIPLENWKKRLNDLKKFQRNFKRARVLLGPVELVHHKIDNGKSYETVNLGDIPISLKYFVEWISCKVLSKDEVFYPLSVFLNQLINHLVTNFLNSNDCFLYDIKQKIRVNQAVITSYSAEPDIDRITELTYESWANEGYFKMPLRLDLSSPTAQDNRPILNISGRPGNNGLDYAPLAYETNYLTFFAGRTAASGRTVDRARDEAAGLFHYGLGSEKGLLKEIKLRKTQTKGLAEARFEQDGYDGLQQLRVVYDVDISSYANVNTFPGTYIYIPAEGFDPAFSNYQIKRKNGKPLDLTTLGIGGYYMIIRSTHRFAPGEASTQINAKWVNSLETDYPNRDAGLTTEQQGDEASESTCARIAEREDWR